MSYIIDGHNLIGVMPDIQLSDPDDELRLLARLRAYRAKSGSRPMVVFFDSSDLPAGSLVPPGRSGSGYIPPSRPGRQDGQAVNLSSPGIEVRFSRPGQTADDAIVAYLEGRAQPGQYAVVTNDQELARRARAGGASLIRASDFAARLGQRVPREAPISGKRGSRPVRPEPVPDPNAPVFADIYAGFLAAEKNRARFDGAPQADPAHWIEQLNGSDVEAAQAAARWLGQYGGRQALEPLRDALTHGDVRVRAAALLALGDLGDPAGLPDLRERLVKDTASMARQAAAQSLGRIGDRSVEAALEAAVKSDPKSKVRRAAQTALAQIRARQGRKGRTGT
jgi:predicted RNA-binding protein with PIN domain